MLNTVREFARRWKITELIEVVAPTGMAALNVSGQTIHTLLLESASINDTKVVMKMKKVKADIQHSEEEQCYLVCVCFLMNAQ